MAVLCGLAVSTLYLRRGVIVVHVAGVHILRHDDEGQEVWGAERAGVAARAKGKEKSLFTDSEVMRRKRCALGGECDECLRTWSRRRAVWCEPGWRHAAPPPLLSPRCCWAAGLNGAPGTRCTARTAWGGWASPPPDRREDAAWERQGCVCDFTKQKLNMTLTGHFAIKALKRGKSRSFHFGF